jgi:hypothetical protein
MWGCVGRRLPPLLGYWLLSETRSAAICRRVAPVRRSPFPCSLYVCVRAPSLPHILYLVRNMHVIRFCLHCDMWRMYIVLLILCLGAMLSVRARALAAGTCCWLLAAGPGARPGRPARRVSRVVACVAVAKGAPPRACSGAAAQAIASASHKHKLKRKCSEPRAESQERERGHAAPPGTPDEP